jgi:hypothetical protein
MSSRIFTPQQTNPQNVPQTNREITFREGWELPSSRQHIINHPQSKIANLYSDSSKISPTWGKVSTTPFRGKYELCGGYGKRLQKTSISNDMPLNTLNPDRVRQPTNRMDHDTCSVTKKPPTDPLAASYVLPGGAALRQAILKQKTMESSQDNYRTFKSGKQTYIDVVVPDRPSSRSLIKWRPHLECVVDARAFRKKY